MSMSAWLTERVPRRLVWGGVAALLLLAGALVWLLSGKDDPRILALGEWKEPTARLYVEVTPELATARGIARGAVKYEWLQTAREPYRIRILYRQYDSEALLSFPDRDTAVLEPQIWDALPSAVQRSLRSHNRRHHRPDQEIRLVFKRRRE